MVFSSRRAWPSRRRTVFSTSISLLSHSDQHSLPPSTLTSYHLCNTAAVRSRRLCNSVAWVCWRSCALSILGTKAASRTEDSAVGMGKFCSDRSPDEVLCIVDSLALTIASCSAVVSLESSYVSKHPGYD